MHIITITQGEQAMKIITNNEEETTALGEKLGKTLPSGAVVAFFGGLGAGKTAFTRGLAVGLGIKAGVSSPTFNIVNEYPGNPPLFHFDLYRLESESELYDIGWDDYLERGGVCAVEWGEKAGEAFPENAIFVKIENMGGERRSFEIRS